MEYGNIGNHLTVTASNLGLLDPLGRTAKGGLFRVDLPFRKRLSETSRLKPYFDVKRIHVNPSEFLNIIVCILFTSPIKNRLKTSTFVYSRSVLYYGSIARSNIQSKYDFALSCLKRRILHLLIYWIFIVSVIVSSCGRWWYWKNYICKTTHDRRIWEEICGYVRWL